MMWDFFTLRPETIHQMSVLFSDRGTPDGYRHMNGYGSHTFKTVNDHGEAFYVKWHFKTDQGIKNLPADEADRLASSDPDYAIRDLYNAIASGNPPSWTMYAQVGPHLGPYISPYLGPYLSQPPSWTMYAQVSARIHTRGRAWVCTADEGAFSQSLPDRHHPLPPLPAPPRVR